MKHHSRSNWLILALCGLVLLETAVMSYAAFERLPHLEDEVAYLFQAKTLALGRLTVPSPSQPEAFWMPFVLDHRGERFGKYPPGWPAVLALGVLMGAPWLVNPLLSALALYLVYEVGRELYDLRTGLLAAVLGSLSPLLIVLGGSFLSHLVTMVWLLLFTLWFVKAAKGRHWLFALGSGGALGMAFLTRSLTAVAYATPFIVYSLVQVVRRTQGHWRVYIGIALTGGTLSSLLFLYQWRVTGNPWLNPYLLWWPYDRLGFGPGIGAMSGGHSPFYAWINLKQDLSRAATDLLGWPALSWIPVALALSLAPRRQRAWALVTPFACLVIAYLFYWIGSPSRLWGPRYYFEGFAGLWILSAVGLLRVWDQIREHAPRTRLPFALALLTIMIVSTSITVPPRMREAHGFYGISRQQFSPIQEAGLQRALVIVYAQRWLEYGALLSSMGPLLDDDLIYARGSGAEVDAQVVATFPDRDVYYLHNGHLYSGAGEWDVP